MLLTLMLTAMAGGPVRAALGTTVTLPRRVVEPGETKMLYLAMENRTDRRLFFEEHATGPCFVAKYADITLDPPAPKRDTGACPVGNRPVAPGEVFGMVVALNEVFETTADRYGIEVTWKDGGSDVYSRVTESVGPLKVVPATITRKLQKGDQVNLPNKNTLIFEKHSWQASKQRGAPQDLVVHFKLLKRGEGEEELSVTITPDKVHQVRVDGYLVDIGAYQFDRWMDFRLFDTPDW